MATPPLTQDDLIDIEEVTQLVTQLFNQFSYRMEQERFCPIDEEILDLVLGKDFADQVRSRAKHKHEAYFASAFGFLDVVVWKVKDYCKISSVTGSWNHLFGSIRNQRYHLLCWDYVATDLVSAQSVQSKWEDTFYPLSVAHVCFSCRFDLLETRIIEGEEHSCYAYCVASALRHIQRSIVPREENVVFDCNTIPPLVTPPPSRIGARIEHVATFDGFEGIDELFFCIQMGPVAGHVISYSQIFDKTDEVYIGPLQKGAYFLGSYHAVIVESVIWYKDDLVAVCRMSNGVDVGHNGYLYVSLTTVYMIKSNRKKPDGIKDKTWPTYKPEHLITNFVKLTMHENTSEISESEEKKKQKDNEEGKNDSKTVQGGATTTSARN